ncbi:unnamed protein product [Malus baccata var. baccata]
MAATGQVAGGLTAYDREVLTAVNAGEASLSFVGSGFIVLCYVLFKELRKFSFKLVFYLALSDMLCSFFSMVGDVEVASSSVPPVRDRIRVLEKGLIRVHLLLFLLFTGTSLVVTLVCSIGNNHSHLGTWCWSQSGRTGKALNLITFHMPLWGAVLYNGFYIFSSDNMLENARHMAGGMSDLVYQSDSRAEMKFLMLGQLDSRTCSTPCGLNSSVRRAIYERLDLLWPDRLKRWFPNSSRFRNQQLRSELVALKIEDPHQQVGQTEEEHSKEFHNVVPRTSVDKRYVEDGVGTSYLSQPASLSIDPRRVQIHQN